MESKWHYSEFMDILCHTWLQKKETDWQLITQMILWFQETELSHHPHKSLFPSPKHNNGFIILIKMPALPQTPKDAK